MKKLLLIFLPLVVIISSGCHETVQGNQSKNRYDTGKSSALPGTSTGIEQNTDDLGDYSELIPLEIKDSVSKNVYEKYGIDFSGNCYSCDLAEIRINKKHIDLVNVCDENNIYRIEGFTYSTDDNNLKINTDKNEFLFTRIDNAPVYKLEIRGSKIDLKEKKIAIYFTQKKQLSKFKEHECGDFQG
ncbi:MAG: hypothetical protein WAU23_06770 [Ferruginibacter sp.]